MLCSNASSVAVLDGTAIATAFRSFPEGGPGNQILGGIGTALEEESLIDHNFGRFMNHSLAGYHVPVHADVHDIDMIFVEEHDEVVNPLGAKGIGEIGVVGVGAGIANAVFHATGKRVRELPITPDKLL